MFDRFRLSTLLLVLLVTPFIGCGSSSEIDSIQVTPSTVGLTGVGATAQLQATATIGHGSHPATNQDVTSQVTWSTGSANVATVSATGLVTSVGPGSVQITASINGFTGIVTSSSTITVTVAGAGGGSGGTAEPVASLAIIPSAQSVASPGETGQFLAIGTTPVGSTENLTNQVAWSSSETAVGTIGATTGLATGVSQGTTAITAIWTNPDKTVVTGTATFTVIGGVPEPITALSISPATLTLSATGQTGQFVALGTSGTTGLQQDVTHSAQLSWSSSVPSIATVSASGLVTGVSPGATTIRAQWTNPDSSVVSATASVSVTATAAAEPLLSIVVLPNSITDLDLLGTGQYLAYGTFSTAPTVMDITNGFTRNGVFTPVTWISTAPYIFPINSAGAPGATGGLVTAVGSGTDDIYAVSTNPDGTLVYSPTVTFNCPYVAYTPATATAPAVLGSCNPETIASGLLVTLTVFNAGLNTTNWLITAPSATGTPDVIHCGPGSTSGGSVCTATYPVGTTVTLTAPAQAGVAFGGWSFNCAQQGTVTAAGPNTCTVTLGTSTSSNESVGAIFN